MTCQRIGLSPISTSALGIACVLSCSRVPRPPQRMATAVSAAGGLAATGDGGKDRYLVAVRERCGEAVLEADVLARNVDVDEAAQGPVLGDPLAKVGVLREDCVERLAHRAALDLDLLFSVGDGAELRWDLDRDRHRRGSVTVRRSRRAQSARRPRARTRPARRRSRTPGARP